LSQDFRGKGSSLGNIFGFYKTRHILLFESANCTVLRAVVLTQYRRVTDGQTDEIAAASTALAMRALRRCKKVILLSGTSPHSQCADKLLMPAKPVGLGSCVVDHV